MQADVTVAHLALEFSSRHQRGHAIYDQHVHRARADQRVANFERLLAAVGLAEQQVVDIDAELARVDRVERVLRVDKGANAAASLRLGNCVQGERGLARALRPVDFEDAASGQATDAERQVEPERARRDRFDLLVSGARTHAHDAALAEGPLDLRQRRVERPVFFHSAFLFDNVSAARGRIYSGRLQADNSHGVTPSGCAATPSAAGLRTRSAYVRTSGCARTKRELICCRREWPRAVARHRR